MDMYNVSGGARLAVVLQYMNENMNECNRTTTILDIVGVAVAPFWSVQPIDILVLGL